MRNSGPSVPETNGAFVHQALVYSEDEEFLAAALPFVRDGLANSDPVFVAITSSNIQLLRDALGADAALVEFVDSEEFYQLPARSLAAFHERFHRHAEGTGRFRAIGEPLWSGSDLEVKEWKRYESIANAAFASFNAWIVCPYASSALDPSVIADAMRTHPEVLHGRQAHRSLEYADPVTFSRALDADELPEPGVPVEKLLFTSTSDLRSVRGFITEHATRGGLTREQVSALAIAANEVVTNALEHGGGHGRVRLWAEPGEVVCEVVDPGGQIDDPFPGYLPPPPSQNSGRGLWLARQLCELMEVRSGSLGSTVRLHVCLG